MHVNASVGNIGIAIYDSTSSGITCLPNARLATTGSIAAPAGGSAIVDLGTTVTGIGQGTHWLALSASSLSFLFYGIGSITTAYQGGVAAAQTTGHPPPSTAAPTATTTATPQFVLDPA